MLSESVGRGKGTSEDVKKWKDGTGKFQTNPAPPEKLSLPSIRETLKDFVGADDFSM
jgi:hypothetical protein